MNLFILFGQTATGKTAKALELVDKHDGEIVNFDSRQIYKKLNIVTGKDIPPNSKFKVQSLKQKKYTLGYYELSAFNFQLSTRIWLYDIVDPKKTFSSAEYVIAAVETIKDILSRGKTPILVGGTGYYLRHLLFGIPETNVHEDKELRKDLENKTVKVLQEILAKKNVALLNGMNNSDRNNPRRLMRRIEIAMQGGSLLPQQQSETLSTRLGVSLTFIPFFHASQEIAREKISLRVEERLKNGAIKEVENLLKEGYVKDDPGLNAIGYSQLISYLQNETTLDVARETWINREVQYAKRQKTYFKKYFFTNHVVA